MNLLGRLVGLDQPFFPIAGPACPLDRMDSLLTTLVELDRLVKQRGFEESRA